MRDFCHVYNCHSIIKDKTCFKNPHNLSCIDLFMTNRPKSFQNSMVIDRNRFVLFPLNVINSYESLVQKATAQNFKISELP